MISLATQLEALARKHKRSTDEAWQLGLANKVRLLEEQHETLVAEHVEEHNRWLEVLHATEAENERLRTEALAAYDRGFRAGFEQCCEDWGVRPGL